MCSLAHPLVHVFTSSLTHSFTHVLPCSPTRLSFDPLLTQIVNHSSVFPPQKKNHLLLPSLTCSFIHAHIHPCVYPSFHSPTHFFIHHLPIHPSIHPSFCSPNHSSIFKYINLNEYNKILSSHGLCVDFGTPICRRCAQFVLQKLLTSQSVNSVSP